MLIENEEYPGRALTEKISLDKEAALSKIGGMEYDYSNSSAYIQEQSAKHIATKIRTYMNKVYAWLALSLVVSAGSAIYVESDYGLLEQTLNNRMVLAITTLGIVLVMCFAANKLTAGALKVLLLAYSVLQGVLFAPFLMVFSNHTLGVTFACTAGMFGAMALYGMTTKRNLSGMGRTLLMLLIGLIIASLVNLFVGDGTMTLVISIAGIVIFSLFTAYDFQRLQEEGAICDDATLREKGAILGALSLYINFYNLFLYLLRFLGDRE